MLIATFGPTTGWAGKTITFENEQIILEDHGPILAEHVVDYDRQGHLVWPYDGMRAWAYARAQAAPVVPVQRATRGPATQPAGSQGDAPTVLIFDTETSGLPQDWDGEPEDVENWPHVVEIAWIVCDMQLRKLRAYETLIRPEGWTISPGSRRVHGISTEKARQRGVPIGEVLPAFAAELDACGIFIAHNLEFDQSVMTAEFVRAGIRHAFYDRRGFCTMKSTADLCQIGPKFRGHYKYPRLSELHEICIGKPHDGAHGAMADTEAILRILQAMKKAKVIELEAVPRS